MTHNLKENILKQKELIEDFKTKMDIILDITSIESDEQIFKELNDDFNTINRELVEEVNDNCRLIYNFLQGILEYQSLKKIVQELKKRLEQLYIKIQLETQHWPKRKKFYLRKKQQKEKKKKDYVKKKKKKKEKKEKNV